MSKRHLIIALYGCLTLGLAACATGTPAVNPTGLPPSATVTATLPVSAVSASPTPAPGPAALQVWLPASLAPEAGPGGQALAEQLRQYAAAHADLKLEVRVKAETGQSGLFRALTAAYNVAPSILPNLIALNRDELAEAVAAGLVIPLDQYLPAETWSDYYPFAQLMSRAQTGTFYGAPFAADARVLAYKSNFHIFPPLQWSRITTGTLVIPAGELSALMVVHTYLSLGGTLTDAEGQVNLNADVLAQALTVFGQMREAGLLSPSTLAYTDEAATWQAFLENRATLAVVSANRYLVEHSEAGFAVATLIPAVNGEQPFALAQGWSWAIVNAKPEQQAAAGALVNWLIEPGQLAAWTQAANVLPPRAAALAAWPDTPTTTMVRATLEHATLRPAGAVLARVGPPLQQALAEVLNGRAAPVAAANTAVQALTKP